MTEILEVGTCSGTILVLAGPVDIFLDSALNDGANLLTFRLQHWQI
jgi:hypothetical protein